MIRIDSHQHFWRYNPDEYPWITADKAALKRDYVPDDLAPLLEAAGFDGAITVQARQSIEETAWLLELAGRHPFIKGVVGWVDLCGIRRDEQLAEYGPRPSLVGVRHVVHDEPDDGFMRRSDFRAGVAGLERYGLVYDLLLFPRHLPVACELVREFPRQSFVLDHIAKPPIRRKEWKAWARDLRPLAQMPNVACKLSGMVTEAGWQQWRPEDFRVYLDVVFEAFGASRLMIGSDWPVCTLSGAYGATMAIVSDYVAALPEAVRAGVLGANCARIYGVEAGEDHG